MYKPYEPLGYHHQTMNKLRVFGVYKNVETLEGNVFKIFESRDSIKITTPSSLSDERINQKVDDYFKKQTRNTVGFVGVFVCMAIKIKNASL
ncbi:hypothetical protein MX850_03685 [Erysipelothrix sp. Poltava]|nr:hypothetical protein MX850_03685 [Erysipelothrix sp. Poltava]